MWPHVLLYLSIVKCQVKARDFSQTIKNLDNNKSNLKKGLLVFILQVVELNLAHGHVFWVRIEIATLEMFTQSSSADNDSKLGTVKYLLGLGLVKLLSIKFTTIVIDVQGIYIYIYIHTYSIKLKVKIQFNGFIINLFQVYGDPLQMKTGIALCILTPWIIT